jgi:hypothetical protein
MNNSIDYNVEIPIFDINPFSSLIPIISSFLGLPQVSSHNIYSNMSYNVPKNMLQIMSHNNPQIMHFPQISSSENFLVIVYE